VTIEDWDRFVASNPLATYLQVSAWARVKAANGWSSTVVSDEKSGALGPVGAQILMRRPGPAPWTFAYAPRGPIATDWRRAALADWTATMRDILWAASGRISHLRIDPEIEPDGPFDPDGTTRRTLSQLGWRRAPAVQPTRTRVIDLTAPEEALWSDLRKKWRQYVNRARSQGVTVQDVESDRLEDFHRIMGETASRTGTHIRAPSAYRDVWEAYRPAGMARLLLASDASGAPQAALFLVRCGTRVVEPYGGMTAAGAESRANYLVKWEAIRTSREQGATSYDMWGLVNPGIAHFKGGFGGREVRTIGAWDLDLRPLGGRLYRLAERLAAGQRRRQRSSTGASTMEDSSPREGGDE
jgi:peptidoglycan pentaglycine glycine transferase (the first glycine)